MPGPTPEKPRTVVLAGTRVTIVGQKPSYWVERTPDGIAVHAGKVIDDQVPMRWLDAPKPCSICKVPTQAATPRGRAVHPTCEGWTSVLPDDVFAQTAFAIAADLGATFRSEPTKELRRAA